MFVLARALCHVYSHCFKQLPLQRRTEPLGGGLTTRKGPEDGDQDGDWDVGVDLKGKLSSTIFRHLKDYRRTTTRA